jgi:acetylornithine deacetylase/succinyl-diaminopimelate desuccinylase-like protein
VSNVDLKPVIKKMQVCASTGTVIHERVNSLPSSIKIILILIGVAFLLNSKESTKTVDHRNIVEIAEQAMKDANIEPKIKAIRGGTDGAQLSYMGLPCPNIFAGGENFHGPYEYVALESMEKAVKVIVNIAKAKK